MQPRTAVTEQTGLEGEIAALVAELFAVPPPAPDTDLLGRGILDSLRLVDLLLSLERRYAVRIPLDSLELDQIRSVARLAALVAERREGG